MKYEALLSTIIIEMSLLDIFALTANLHLALKHPKNDSWSAIHSKTLGRRFLKCLVDNEIELPDETLKEYQDVFGKE
jgi:hypothetical protein